MNFTILSVFVVNGFGPAELLLEFLYDRKNHKKVQSFMSRYLASGNILVQLKPEVDLCNFATPVNNLLEPDIKITVFTALNKYAFEDINKRPNFLC